MNRLFLALLLPLKAHACAVCQGDPASPLTQSANAGVLFLLAVVSIVVASFGGIFYRVGA